MVYGQRNKQDCYFGVQLVQKEYLTSLVTLRLTLKAISMAIDLRAGTNDGPCMNLRCFLMAMTLTTPLMMMSTPDIANRGQYSGGGSDQDKIFILVLSVLI